jgi:hypothetical protein
MCGLPLQVNGFDRARTLIDRKFNQRKEYSGRHSGRLFSYKQAGDLIRSGFGAQN